MGGSRFDTVFDNRSDYCYVIAEAGSNHDGSLSAARRLVDIAAQAGADAVKFQLFKAERIASACDDSASRLSGQFERYGRTLRDLYAKLEFNPGWLDDLVPYCARAGIDFIATPFDEASADTLEAHKVPHYKIASFEINHLPLLKHVARFGKPVILSTGMASLADIEEAVDALESEGNRQIVLLHCGVAYPPRFQDVNLRSMNTIGEAFGYPVGYSDHTPGIVVPVAAVARGARVIEKHFTFDKRGPGPDHGFSLDASELAEMVNAVRATTAALGGSRKRRTAEEEEPYRRGRRSLFAATDIPAGAPISRDMVAVLRPGIGLAPRYLDLVVGRQARRPIKKDDPIVWDDL